MSQKPSAAFLSLQPMHLDYLDSLRALAALYVIVQHALLHTQLNSMKLPWLQQLLVDSFSFGHYAVDLFIVLSGFCLMLPVVKNNGRLRTSALQFFKKRARRILPPYYLAMAASLVLIFTIIGQKTGTHWDESIPVGGKDIFTHLFLIQDLFHDTNSTINHAFWSISVEWRIYFLFPLLVLAWKRFGPILTSLLAVIVSLGIQFLLRDSSYFNFSPWGICPHYVGLFTLGCLSAEIAFSQQRLSYTLRQNLPWQALTLLGAGLILLVSHKGILLGKNVPWPLQDLMVGLWAMVLLVALALPQETVLKSLVSWKPLSFCGTFAYSIYLIHAPLLQVLSQYLLTPLGLVPFLEFILLVTVGLPLILALSYGFYWFCERPFLSKPVERKVRLG
jgi:peptidoglycan/LPS O-acetylase OafA/YrhL